MSKDNETKMVWVPVFDGKEGSFQTWQIRFRAYAKIAGFSKAIRSNPETDMPGSQSNADGLAGVTAAEKKKLAAVSRNNAAMASLTLSFTTDELISKIINAQSSE